MELSLQEIEVLLKAIKKYECAGADELISDLFGVMLGGPPRDGDKEKHATEQAEKITARMEKRREARKGEEDVIAILKGKLLQRRVEFAAKG